MDDPVIDLELEEQKETPESSQQEEYINLETYNNKYYTCNSRSNSERLIALTDFTDSGDQNIDPCKRTTPSLPIHFLFLLPFLFSPFAVLFSHILFTYTVSAFLIT